MPDKSIIFRISRLWTFNLKEVIVILRSSKCDPKTVLSEIFVGHLFFIWEVAPSRKISTHGSGWLNNSSGFKSDLKQGTASASTVIAGVAGIGQPWLSHHRPTVGNTPASIDCVATTSPQSWKRGLKVNKIIQTIQADQHALAGNQQHDYMDSSYTSRALGLLT